MSCFFCCPDPVNLARKVLGQIYNGHVDGSRICPFQHLAKLLVLSVSFSLWTVVLQPGGRNWFMITSKNDCGETFIYSPSTGYLAKQIRYEDLPL